MVSQTEGLADQDDSIWSGQAENMNRFSLASLDSENAIPETMSDVIEYFAEKSIRVDQEWPGGLIYRHETELTMQKASILEQSRHEVMSDNVKR
jgi:hypothetical protein